MQCSGKMMNSRPSTSPYLISHIISSRHYLTAYLEPSTFLNAIFRGWRDCTVRRELALHIAKPGLVPGIPDVSLNPTKSNDS